jgi:hypothetical protein
LPFLATVGFSILLLAAPLGSAAVATMTGSKIDTGALPVVLGPGGANASWNGHNISGAGSVGSAFSISKGQTATVYFRYAGSLASSVKNATLQVNYLGLVLTTSRSSTSALGGPPIVAVAAQINWSFGPLYDALEGVFQFTAAFLNANGSTVWSSSFFVIAKAPYQLESGAVIVLLVLLVAELYWGIASVRDARRGRKPSVATPPPPSPPGGSSPSGTPPPSAPPDSGATGVPPETPAEPPAASESPSSGGTP